MTRIAFLTLGCKLNYAETSTYTRAFRAAGWEVVPWREKADFYLVNTCSVTATADTKSRSLVRKVHRLSPGARIIVTGCSAELRRASLEALDGVWRVFGALEKAQVVPETLAAAGGPPADVPMAEVFPAYSSGERTRSFLKVQDGCDNFCRYCTVPYARGRSRNVPVCECVRMAQEIASQGVREIVLTGVNTGDFGRTTGESFAGLLKALEAVEGIERYRISSIEPNLLTEEIIDFCAARAKFQPHFHIPLQTGTDILLERMGRRYDTAFFASRIDYVREAFAREGRSPVFFGIDVMAGLPGETPELFERTVEFIRSVRPAFIHVFPYSPRPGTPAARMDGQVDAAEKARRVARLELLCEELHARFREECRGLREKVLWESTKTGGHMEGYTGNYLRVERPWDASLVNTIEEITI